MKALRYLHLSIADCRRDIARLSSLEQQGAYFEMLLTCAERDGVLENDKKTLKFVAQLSEKSFREFWPKFSQIFELKTDDNKWHHPTIDYQIECLEKSALQHSEAGKKGMEKRWGNRNERYNGKITTDITSDITTDTKKHNERYNGGITSAPAISNRESESLNLPTESQEPRPRARPGHVPGKIGSFASVGRSAPLARPKASPKPHGLKDRIKEQYRQKLYRFADATLLGEARRKAFLGLGGGDPEHNEQWWLDHLSAQMRDQGWNDVEQIA